MPEYKLSYFQARALGEPIRFLLSFMNIDFEDYRFEYSYWLTKKYSTPFGCLPILEIDGQQLHQSVAICRYLGKLAGIAGDTDMESLQIDIAVETFQDFRLEFKKYFFMEKEEKEIIKDKLINEVIPFYMSRFDKLIESNAGYLANKKLSWGDIYVVAFSETLNDIIGLDIFTEQYPNFISLRNRIFAIPEIQRWIKKRPVTDL